MSLSAVLALGFFLGMRHATDPDHVVAVSTIVSRTRTFRAAAPIGVLWGLGHTLTILVVGAAIIVFGVVVPPRLGLGMELTVALMLVVLGALTLRRSIRGEPEHGHTHPHEHPPPRRNALLPLVVGVVHGLAGSAAIALLVLGAIRDPLVGVLYLLVFGAGTVAGMLLVTLALATPLAVAGARLARFQRSLVAATGIASVAFGGFLTYETGFAQGLFTDHPTWTPR